MPQPNNQTSTKSQHSPHRLSHRKTTKNLNRPIRRPLRHRNQRRLQHKQRHCNRTNTSVIRNHVRPTIPRPRRTRLHTKRRHTIRRATKRIPQHTILLPISIPLRHKEVSPTFRLMSQLPQEATTITQPQPTPRSIHTIQSTTRTKIHQATRNKLPQRTIRPSQQ